jgi:hypothetical protein
MDARTNDLAPMTGPMRRVQAAFGRPLEEVLTELYFERGMTLNEVGAELGRVAGVDPLVESTVSRWMHRLGLDRRFPGQRPRAEVS